MKVTVQSIRFDEQEGAMLDTWPAEHRMTKAGAVRLAWRLLTGLPVPSWALLEFEREIAKRRDRDVVTL